MTLTADHPARANRDGHPCPSWCATDHDREIAPGIFQTTHGTSHARVSVSERGYDRLLVSGDLFPSDGERAVHVSGGNEPLFVPPEMAEGAAALVELLADATPEQHRELAAAIRQAAAVITEAGNG